MTMDDDQGHAEQGTGSGILLVFGRQLKRFRECTEYDRAAFWSATGYSASTIASHEQGRRVPPPRFIEQADELLGAQGCPHGTWQGAGAGDCVRDYPRAGSHPVGLPGPGRKVVGRGMSREVTKSDTRSLAWFKSSYSAGDGGQCVEIAVTWHKSSYSAGDGGDCVEVASCLDAVHVRDSKNLAGPMLTLEARAWGAFVEYARESRAV